jgi:metacaspase-1
MLTARRFTALPTRDCRTRLDAALANQRAIARGEPHRGAVSAIQAALADLSQGYLLAAEIDGFFGLRTLAAVETFQRDYGLAADGIVGRQVLTQLNTLYSDPMIRQSVGRSIHVGVDRVDPAHYGAAFALQSCVNDARKMQEIADGLGYDTTILENEAATVANFTGFMRGAISNLVAGDSLMITFSGHGSQLPNTSDDAEADMLDETLCFYDRMLLDDELYSLFSQLREGVSVVAVFDSCHSGTVGKDPLLDPIPLEYEAVKEVYKERFDADLKELTTVPVVVPVGAPAGEEPVSGQPIAAKGLSAALEGERPEMADPPQPTEDVDGEIAELFAGLRADGRTGKAKALLTADFNRIYADNKNLYDTIKNVVGPQENLQVVSTVVTLSACQDPQTTPAGQVYSLFTYNIMSAWGSAGFDGSYRQFHRRLMDVSPPDSTPALNTYGANRAEARLHDRPFAF